MIETGKLFEISGYEERAQAFSMQYTSLMLIVLTFIIAVYFTPHNFEVPKDIKTIITPEPDVGVMTLENVFDQDSSSVNLDQISALQFLVANHDVDINVDVYAKEDELALARSMMLYRAFLDMGVLSSAVQVFSHTGTNSQQVNIRFYDVKKSW